ncbi:MAG: DUF4115 domain-containing protein [Anaerolineales bacterium]|nr:DUF4115 domain-containing protein [Anaerolineales bacterium]
MEDLGRRLREAREQLGITLDEAERATRIRTHHLAALERGDLEALPSPVQARGFLGNYADFLGLDVDEVLLRYAERQQTRRSRIKPLQVRDETSAGPSVQIRSRRPRWLSFDLFFAATVTLGVIAVLIWGGSRMMASLRQGSRATEAALEFFIPTQEPTFTPSPTPGPLAAAPESAASVPSTETVVPTQPIILGISSEVNIRIVAQRRSWLRVVVDGEEAYEGRMSPDEERVFTGLRSVEVTTGNGAGLRVFYNGQDQGVMGDVGQVVDRIWTLDGVLTPTPTQTHTPTPSPPATETPTAIATTPQG